MEPLNAHEDLDSSGRDMQRLSLDAFFCRPSITYHITICKSYPGRLQRIFAKPTVKKDPVTLVMLEDIVKDVNRSNMLSDLRLTTALLLAYAGSLCINKFFNIRPCDITRYEGIMILHLPHSKTDQL